MPIGERIRSRLKDLGISQAELARRTGLHQTTINGLIRNGGNTRYLHRIAQELQTTPAYLSGDAEDASAEAPVFEVTSQERDLIEITRRLSIRDRTAVLRHARALADFSAP